MTEHAIIFGPASLGGHWSFESDDKHISIKVDGRPVARASEGAIAVVVAGLGIVMTSLGACRRELEEGALIPVLLEWDAGSVDLNAQRSG